MKTKCLLAIVLVLGPLSYSVSLNSFAAIVKTDSGQKAEPGQLLARIKRDKGPGHVKHLQISKRLGDRSTGKSIIQKYFDHLFDGQSLNVKELEMIKSLIADFSKRGKTERDIQVIQTKLLDLKIDILKVERERVHIAGSNVYPQVKQNLMLQLEKLFRMDFTELHVNDERTTFNQYELERWIDHFLKTDESTFPVRSFLELLGILTGRYDALFPKTHDARLMTEHDVENASEAIVFVDPFVIRPLVIAYQTSKERLSLPEQVFLKLPAVQMDGKRLDLDTDDIIPVYTDENVTIHYVAVASPMNGYTKFQLQISK